MYDDKSGSLDQRSFEVRKSNAASFRPFPTDDDAEKDDQHDADPKHHPNHVMDGKLMGITQEIASILQGYDRGKDTEENDETKRGVV